jgi:hypothetical protein
MNMKNKEKYFIVEEEWARTCSKPLNHSQIVERRNANGNN